MTSVESHPSPVLLGHQLFGSGRLRVVFMHDWLSDTSSWDVARSYFDENLSTCAFADLRGYGRSISQSGSFTLGEATSDIIALADALDWEHFSIVGHSMSSLVALQLAQRHTRRIERVVVVTPPPLRGFDADDAMLAALRGFALADDATRLTIFSQQYGARLSPGWSAFKARRWRATAKPAAAAGYVAMFARDGLSEPTARITVPVLAITGELDAPPMRYEPIKAELTPICDELTVIPLAESGHYPMQEVPPLTVAHIERFLDK